MTQGGLAEPVGLEGTCEIDPGDGGQPGRINFSEAHALPRK